MGWWPIGYSLSAKGVIGDGVADIMEHALGLIREEYREEMGRDPTPEELAALWAFCTAGGGNDHAPA